MQTRSPRPTPKDFRAFAIFETSSFNSAKLIFRTSPGSPSQRIAVLFARFPFACLSTQFLHAFSFPPTNHFTNGGFDQSSASVHGWSQSNFFAHPSQKPTGSAAAFR